MKKILFFVGFMLSFFGLSAEDTTTVVRNWAFSGFVNQDLNQISFTNWASGGENSFSSTTILRLNANYKKGNNTWENYLEGAYGIIKTQDMSMRKNEDKLDLFSKYGRTVSEKTSISALANFKTQWDRGYNYPNDSMVVSRFMSPAYLIAALGIDYKPRPFLSLFVSPTTGKFTFVMDQTLADRGSYGVKGAIYDTQGNMLEKGENVNPEFGAMLRANFNKEVWENVRLNTTLELFNNYTDKDKRNRKNTDVNWETNITMPINRFLTANISLHLQYDHDIPIPIYETLNGEKVQTGTGPRTQFKQLFGLGFVYNFK